MKKTLLVAAVAISALFAGSAAMAQDDAGAFSFNIGATNNYVWRGVTQTEDGAAVQGGVDYKKGIFYAGAWGSNVSFAGDSDTSTELDLYVGLAPSVGDWNFDFGYIHYMYPNECDTCDYAVGELKAAVSHSLGKGTIGAAMYLDADTLEDPYYEVNASYPLTDKLSVSGAIANNEYYGDGYATWNVGTTYALTDSLSLDLRYSEASKRPSNLYATIKVGF